MICLYHSPQRYFVNDGYWGGPGFPIFLYIGNEGTEDPSKLAPGRMFMYDLAVENSALMFDLEASVEFFAYENALAMRV